MMREKLQEKEKAEKMDAAKEEDDSAGLVASSCLALHLVLDPVLSLVLSLVLLLALHFRVWCGVVWCGLLVSSRLVSSFLVSCVLALS